MQLCQTCPLKANNTCNSPCEKLEAYLKGERNYKTTYVNKEEGLNIVHENLICEFDSDYEDSSDEVNAVYGNLIHGSLDRLLDTSGSFIEKFGHLLPTIRTIVKNYGTDSQKEIYRLWVTDGKSFPFIADHLHIKRQSVQEAIYGKRNQGGLIRKIRKHLHSQGKLPAVSLSL